MAVSEHEELLKRQKGIGYVGITTCFICHDGAGRIFMAKRSKNARDEQGTWDVGGGGLDWGISAEENAKKEIAEEYGVTAHDVTFLGYRDVFRKLPDGTKTHWLALDFIARINREHVRINEPEKFDDAGWFTLDDLPAPLHSQNTHMFEKHHAKLAKLLLRGQKLGRGLLDCLKDVDPAV